MSQVSSHAMTIFGDALECASPDERARYLDRACGGDADLRAHIEHLLRAHGEAGQFLGGGDRPAAHGGGGAPASMADAATAASDRPGARIGPYKLLEQIGE